MSVSAVKPSLYLYSPQSNRWWMGAPYTKKRLLESLLNSPYDSDIFWLLIRAVGREMGGQFDYLITQECTETSYTHMHTLSILVQDPFSKIPDTGCDCANTCADNSGCSLSLSVVDTVPGQTSWYYSTHCPGARVRNKLTWKEQTQRLPTPALWPLLLILIKLRLPSRSSRGKISPTNDQPPMSGL